MNFILFDDDSRDQLLPLTFTRPVADIRVGILSIREKWECLLACETSSKTQEYLAEKFPIAFTIDTDNYWINGSVCPDTGLVEAVKALEPGNALVSGETLIAVNSGNGKSISYVMKNEWHSPLFKINSCWDIFSLNGKAIEADFALLTKGRKSGTLSKTNRVICPENVFLEEGARVECSVLNASTGVIYIGKDAEIMEGSLVRGPFALCEHATLKLGAKIYGPTTIGPYSKVGGEVNNSVLFAYSNKGHDGFLGNAVIGEWCNLGADTNNSNLKNNYAQVKLWNYPLGRFVNTGLTFCGLIMGDHSKCGINTMFNTGTVVGVYANIFGSGFPRNFVPDFSWGGAQGFTTYKLEDAFEVARLVMARRNVEFSTADQGILQKVFELTEKYRK